MKQPRKNERVRGVLLAKVNEKILTEKLLEIGCSESSLKGKSPSLKLEVFMSWTADKLQKIKDEGNEEVYGQCEECGAPCELDAERCPVCGTANDDVEAPPQEEEPAQVVDLTLEIKELDDAVVRIKTAFRGTMRNHWQLGNELLAVFDNELYLKRCDESGTPLYRSWDQFVITELGFKGPWTRTAMVIARKFTEEQAVALGAEKLRTIASLPENRHAEFLVKAETLSTRELAKEAIKVKNIAPQPKIPPAEKSGLAKGTEAAKKAREERKAAADSGSAMTAVFQLGEYEFPLKLEGKDFLAEQTLVNGVTVNYVIVTTGKRRFMKVKFSRPESK